MEVNRPIRQLPHPLPPPRALPFCSPSPSSEAPGAPHTGRSHAPTRALAEAAFQKPASYIHTFIWSEAGCQKGSALLERNREERPGKKAEAPQGLANTPVHEPTLHKQPRPGGPHPLFPGFSLPARGDCATGHPGGALLPPWPRGKAGWGTGGQRPLGAWGG